MKTSSVSMSRILLLSAAMLTGVAGCAYDRPYSGRVYSSYYYPYYYDYYYYPGVSVYFHYVTGDYYYRSGDRWIRTRVLPSHIRLDPRNRRTIRVKTDKPYLKYPDHRRTYQPTPRIRTDVNRNRQEREHNTRTYQQHQRQQETYKRQWEEQNRRRR
jgi:hypothetical protein